MSGKARNGSGGGFRLSDVIIIIIFLCIAILCLNLFRLDLMQTISLQNVEPVGTVVVKKNTVQRRLADRALWDRLAYESPVYLGDLIRIANVSAATLYIEDNSIDLDENTIIRITRSADGEGFQIILSEGSLSLVTGENGGIDIDLNGRQVQAGPGTTLSAEVNEDGSIAVQVIEGRASFVEGRSVREVSSGMTVALDAGGAERLEKAAVVITPAPNARYLKSTAEPLTVNFSWNRINIDSAERLRLEIALDRNFNQVFRIIENLDRQAQVSLDAGLWFWRLSLEDNVLSAGRVTIVDGAAVALESPALNSLFRYQYDLPVINFQWTEVEEAVSYILEVSNSPDFIYTRIRRQSPAVFFADSLGEGTWYWRVMPVFPPVYEGSAAFSAPAFFSIEQTAFASPEDVSLAQWLASEAPAGLVPPPVAAVEPPRLNLVSPANGTVITGLAALRAGAAFQWETDGDVEIASSRLVISANPNPQGGRPAVEIRNPGRSVRVERLREGTWYWTVEMQTSDGVTVSAPARRLVVQPIPLLPSPRNMSPARGVSFGVQELQSRRNIVFNWSAVQGANAYIFTLYQQTSSGRRQIIRTAAENRTSYTLNNLRLLDRGNFVWQVEAVNIRGGAIEQRGRTGESYFILDFPSPGPVQIEDTGVLYGN